MSIYTAHCWLNDELFSLSEHPGRGFFAGGCAFRLNHWMRSGQPATIILTHDVDHAASCNAMKIREQARLSFLPGHIYSPIHYSLDDIALILSSTWRVPSNITSIISSLTGPENKNEDKTKENTVETCHCDIQTLMLRGCQCKKE